MNVIVQNGLLPQGFCPATLQAMLNGFSAQQFVDISTISGLIVSSTPPADHTSGWLQLDSNGKPVRIYFFAQGAWLSLHPLPSGFTMIWPLGLPDVPDGSGGLPTFDGADALGRSLISGPMWQLCNTKTDGTGTQILTAQFPLGVGTLKSTKVINVQDIGGEENHQLTLSEMFPHFHEVKNVVAASANNFAGGGFNGATIQNINTESAGGDPTTGNPPTNSLGHNTMPPYVGVYFLQRTSRMFYLVNP